MSVEARFAQVLAEMSVISEVPAARHGDVVHGGEKNQAPRGPRRTMADEFAQAWKRAAGPIARKAVLDQAERALIEARISPATHGLVPETLEWRVAIARAEGSVEVVARRFGVARSTVYRCRAGFEPVAA